MPVSRLPKKTDEYSQLKSKMYSRFLAVVFLSVVFIFAVYFIWFGRGADLLVFLMQRIFNKPYYETVMMYDRIFRDNREVIWLLATTLIFLILLRIFVNWFSRYFNLINHGINTLMDEEETVIRLPTEMAAIERKLNTVKQTLRQRTLEVQLAEQRKNDLVMYLAHDIRTPLTSVIGYLNLLEEAPDMPAEQRAKYVNITLDKAYRLEKMINEFFEITRYNYQQISLVKENIDLYYMLVQLCDELTPILATNGNRVTLHADEELTLYGDPDKLARAINNILKNAAAYSKAGTEIIISADQQDSMISIYLENECDTIPKDKLAAIFEKFYRLDESRASDTGGAGLGLSIAREIITLHGGSIEADSADGSVIFMVRLPAGGMESPVIR